MRRKIHTIFKQRKTVLTLSTTGLAAVVLFIFMFPLVYSVTTSLKPPVQYLIQEASVKIVARNVPVWPAVAKTYRYKWREYPVLQVPLPSGETKELALVKKGRRQSYFLDPEHPDAGLILWEGSVEKLDSVWEFLLFVGNYFWCWWQMDFFLKLRNTMMYAVLSTIGVVLSSLIVAYGFARFDFVGKNALFLLVIVTLMLPMNITLAPKYAFFKWIGWMGTWLPLIVPAYFATNGLYIFLLRQFLLTIPREMDEAAAIDGAGPLRTLFLVILPQVTPVVLTVAIFQVVYCWNDFFEPLLYLAGNAKKYPVAVGLLQFMQQYGGQQAGVLLASALPLFLFIWAQRFFIKGVVITGVEK